MNNNPDNDSVDLNKIDADIIRHRKYAFRLIISIFSLFIVYFLIKVFIDISIDKNGSWIGPQFSKLSTVESGDWGTFGDFIGGILNPIFALFAFYWLTYSVRLQIKELRDTKKELEKSANAQLETATHQKTIADLEESNVKTQKEILSLQKKTLQMQIESAQAQQQQIAIQNFENLFFELLKTKNDSLDDIEYKKQNYNLHDDPTDITELKSVDAIKQHIIDFKNDPRGDWLKYYEEKMLDYTGSYFRICYQIVKLINKSDILQANIPTSEDKNIVYSAEQKKYFDIFRATLTKHEIEAFFFNCLNRYGNKKFKKLIEKYGLFEPLPIDHDRLNEKNHRLTRYAYQYESIVFEENSSWKNYFNEVRNIDIKISLEKLNSIFEILVDLSIINKSLLHGLLEIPFEKTSGFCYEFNNAINSKNIFNIFSEENLSKIKDSPTYKNLESQISSKHQSIEQINPIAYSNGDDKLINKLDKIIHNLNLEIKKLQEDIDNLNEKLSSIRKSETTLTAFILIKYGISYIEYSEYIKSKQPFDSP